MKITANEITVMLRKLWPNLIDIWPMDASFWCPTYKELRTGLAKIIDFRSVALEAFGKTAPTGYMSNVHDCDNYALELQADVSRYRFVVAVEKKIPQEELLSWAFGSVASMRVNGREHNHTLTLGITSDAGIVFVEPQNFNMWLAEKEKDLPYFVEMR